jgi:hypothetical protein
VQTHTELELGTATPLTVAVSVTSEAVQVTVIVGALPSEPVIVPVKGIKVVFALGDSTCDIVMHPATPPKLLGSEGHPVWAGGAVLVNVIHPATPPKLLGSTGQPSLGRIV